VVRTGRAGTAPTPAVVANRFDRCFTMITDRPVDVNAVFPEDRSGQALTFAFPIP
jgi:hypothetical protein